MTGTPIQEISLIIEPKARPGKYLAVVQRDGDWYRIGEETDSYEEALSVCDEHAGYPIRIYDEHGIRYKVK